MDEYKNLVHTVLENGTYKPNRTDVDTVSYFSHNYKINVSEKRFPLLTTKKMDTFRWDSLRREVEWYLSGKEHIRELTEDTSIWDAWADEHGRLDTAYGRFWRRFPIPSEASQLDGEAWLDENSKYVSIEREGEQERLVFDQLAHHIDVLSGNHPDGVSPTSRRLMVTPWHPSNAAASTLPPCHAFWGLNVQGDRLNLSLTQRSGDIGLGIPFNIACYSLLLIYIAKLTGFKVGEFSHTIIDSHLYCGSGDRGKWYSDNIDTIQSKMKEVENREDYKSIKKWILNNAPEDKNVIDVSQNKYGDDHIPGLLEQLSRPTYELPELSINPVPLDDLTMGDIELSNYESHGGISFSVAE